MARLTVPIVACIIGEGNSGGAIAIGLVDRVLMQENAIYTRDLARGLRGDPVARRRPEGEGGGRRSSRTRSHCLELGVIDEIVTEPQGGAHSESGRSSPPARAGARQDSRRAVGGAPVRNFVNNVASGTAGSGSTRRVPRKPLYEAVPDSFHRPRSLPLSTASTVFSTVPRNLEAGAKAGPECDPWSRDELFSGPTRPASSPCLRPVLHQLETLSTGFRTGRLGREKTCVRSGAERSHSGSSACPSRCTRRPNRRNAPLSSHKDDLQPIGYDKVRKDTGKHVDPDDVVRGFEIEKGKYVSDRGRGSRPAGHRADPPRSTSRLRRLSRRSTDLTSARRTTCSPQDGAEKPYRLLAARAGRTGRWSARS